MSKNDDKILILTDKISKMKKEMKGDSPVFSPKTNCIFEPYKGMVCNLHAMAIDELRNTLVYLNCIKMSCINLKDGEFNDVINKYEPCYNGYSINDWMDDIASKIRVMEHKEKTKELSKAEKMLEKLLSEDKKVELQIDEIAKQFGLE